MTRAILFASVDSNWAGAQAQMLELAQGLDRGEFTPVLLTTGGGGLVERARDAGITTHVLPHSHLRRRFPFVGYYLAGTLAIRRILQREAIALVHTHCPNSAVPIMRAARGMSLPLVAHIHDLDQRWVTARTLRVQNAERALVVTISDAAARYAAERGVQAAHIRRIYNGVHLPVLPPDARARARATLGARDNELVVGLVGRLARRKGQHDLIRALADQRLRALPLRVYFIGGPEGAEPGLGAELRALSNSLGVADRTVFVGPRDDAPALAAGFDIAVVPSRREAFGRVVIEAMHAGAPVVAYRDAGLPELVRDGVEGRLVPTGDVEALAATLATLAAEPDRRAAMGAVGRCRAVEFDHATFVATVSALYRDLLGAPRSAGASAE